MTSRSLRLDEIGYWSEVKLEIVKKYASAYSRILTNQKFVKGLLYIDAFAGAGTHVAKRTGQTVPGSPVNAMAIEPPYYLYFASANDTGAKIVTDIFDKYRNEGAH